MDAPFRAASNLPEKEGRGSSQKASALPPVESPYSDASFLGNLSAVGAESGAESSSSYAAPNAAPWAGQPWTPADADAIGAAAAIGASHSASGVPPRTALRGTVAGSTSSIGAYVQARSRSPFGGTGVPNMGTDVPNMGTDVPNMGVNPAVVVAGARVIGAPATPATTPNAQHGAQHGVSLPSLGVSRSTPTIARGILAQGGVALRTGGSPRAVVGTSSSGHPPAAPQSGAHGGATHPGLKLTPVHKSRRQQLAEHRPIAFPGSPHGLPGPDGAPPPHVLTTALGQAGSPSRESPRQAGGYAPSPTAAQMTEAVGGVVGRSRPLNV